jgi:hypothetical protein
VSILKHSAFTDHASVHDLLHHSDNILVLDSRHYISVYLGVADTQTTSPSRLSMASTTWICQKHGAYPRWAKVLARILAEEGTKDDPEVGRERTAGIPGRERGLCASLRRVRGRRHIALVPVASGVLLWLCC